MKHFRFEEAARKDLRAIEQRQAHEILLALTRLARHNTGDVKQLSGALHGYHRLRVGDWRVLFQFEGGGAIHVFRVENRKNIYR